MEAEGSLLGCKAQEPERERESQREREEALGCVDAERRPVPLRLMAP